MEGQKQSSDLLRQEIVNQSKTEADAILDQAEKDAKVILDQAGKSADQIHDDLMKQARARSEAIERKILSGVHLEVKREQLRARETMLNTLFDTVRKKFIQFRKSTDYKSWIHSMVVEGVRALGSDQAAIVVHPEDRNLFGAAVLKSLETEIQKQYGISCKLVLSEKGHEDGGVILESPDGRTRFDNTFSARMKRLQDELRLLAIREMDEKTESKRQK